MTRRLFVGGPWHGRVEPVPDGWRSDQWRVPVIPDLAAGIVLERELGILALTDQFVTYTRHKLAAGRTVVEVMTTDRVGNDASAVFRAICERAGLEPRTMGE